MLFMNEHYDTQDICLAVTIQCLGAPLTGIEWRDERRASFCFESSESLHDAVEAYWRNELRIEPKIFFGYLRSTKTRLYNN